MSRNKERNPDRKPSRNHVDSVDLPERYYQVLALALVGVYFVFSYISRGFYQDDEVGHFMSAVNFWRDPFSILGYWQRPGFKLFYVVPALFGIKAVHLLSAAFAGATAYVASHVAREYGMKNRILVMIFCGFSPLFYQISFRTYAEVVGAFLLALMLLFYERHRYVLVALISSYLFTVRQEFVALSLVLGVLFLVKKQWVPFLLLGWTPVLLDLIGWLKTGDPLWLLTTFLKGGENPGHSKPGFFQFFNAFAPIFGATIASLFCVGFLSSLIRANMWKEHVRKYHALYICFLTLFLINSVLSSQSLNISAGQGIWRYILPLTPVVSLFAVIGFNTFWYGDDQDRRTAYFVMIGFIVATAAFFSHTHNYYAYLEPSDYSRLSVLIAMLVVFAVSRGLHMRTRSIVAAVSILTIFHTVQSESPLKLSEENRTIQQLVEWWRGNNYQQRPLLTNHVMFSYFAGITSASALTVKTVHEAEPGSILIWESHYGSRPEYGADVIFDSLRTDRSLKPLRQFVSTDQRWGAVVFEKVDTAGVQ